jgi:hypothetical protein
VAMAAALRTPAQLRQRRKVPPSQVFTDAMGHRTVYADAESLGPRITIVAVRGQLWSAPARRRW